MAFSRATSVALREFSEQGFLILTTAGLSGLQTILYRID